MTRKDYIETGKILNKFIDRLDSIDFNDLVFEFGEWFAADNPNFQMEKFEDICYKEEHFANDFS